MTKIIGLPDLSNVGKRGWLPVFMGFLKELRIQSKEVQATDDRGTKLDLWGSQKMFIKNVCDGMDRGIRDFYNLKSRQLGITTVSLAIDLFWCAVHPRMLGVIVSDTETNRDFFRLTIQNYYNSLPSAFTGGDFVKVKDNEGHMIFSNGSRLDFLVAGTRKKAWGEGRGYTLVHATEVAKWGTAEGIASFRETFAQGNENRLFIWESTAFGPNHWKEMYEEAKRDTYTKKAFFIGWWSKELNSISQKDPRFGLYGGLPDAEERQKIAIVKERYGVSISQEQLAWRRARDADTSTSKADLDQNQPWLEEEAFVQSGHSFFQTRLCAKLLDYICDPQNGIHYKAYRFELGNQFTNSRMYPITQEELELKGSEIIELRVWEEPVEGATYVIGCDPAYGRNDWKDRNAISVWRCFADKLVQAAEFADERVETHQAAWVLAFLAGVYKNCIINIELTGPGRAVFVELNSKRDEFRSELYRKQVEDRGWDDFLATARHYLYKRPDSMGSGYAYSTEATWSLKGRICNQFRDAFTTGVLMIKSGPLVEEMMNVVQAGGAIEAPGTLKDDRVFGAIYALMAYKDWVQASMISNGQTYQAVMESETVGASPVASLTRHIVRNFWKTRSEALENPPEPAPDFFESHGL